MEPQSKSVQFEELLVHASWVRDLARALVRDPNAADDVAQETWLSALQSRPDDRRNLRGWLGKTLTNVVRQRARKDERRSRREEDREREPVPTPAELAERLDTQRMLAEEVARLPEPFRATILLCFYEGRMPSEIARDTDTPAGTVRWRLHEGLALLRAKLDARHGDRKSWMVMLVPLARPSAVATGTIGVVGGGLALMSLSMKLAIAAGLALLLAGIAMWRSSRSVGVHELQTASIHAAGSSASVSSLDSTRRTERDLGQRLAIDTDTSSRFVISGTVMDLPYPELGMIEKPAAGVVVRCVRNWDFGHPDKLQQTTDARGRFKFEWEAARDHEHAPRLEVDGDDDYREAGHFVNDAEPGKAIEDFRLARAAHGVLDGKVVDENGTALEGVALTFIHKNGETRAVSDASGHFEIARLRECVHAPIILKEGMCAVGTPAPTEKAAGGWKHLDVVMTSATGKISLTVVGPAGEPLEGIRAWIEVATTERDARNGGQERPMYSTRPKENSPASDARGRIEFVNVWLNKKLSICLVDGKRRLQAERAVGEDLIFTGREGEPIVLTDGSMPMRGGSMPRGESSTQQGDSSMQLRESSTQQREGSTQRREGSMQLRARMPERMQVRGQVVHADGTPAVKPHVRLQDVDTADFTLRGSRSMLEGDEQGRFQFVFDPSALPALLSLIATDGPLTVRSGSANVGSDEHAASFPVAPYREAATEVLSLGPNDLEGGRTIRVVLEPTFAIAGQARAADGSKGGARITAVPAGTSDRPGPPVSCDCDMTNDGRFRIDGLRAGVYDLLIDGEKRSVLESIASPAGTSPYSIDMSPFVSIRVPGIRAGTEDLDLRVAPAATAEVTLEARPRSGTADRVLVVFGHSNSAEPQLEHVHEAPPEAVFSEHAGCPTPTPEFAHSYIRGINGLEHVAFIVRPGSSFTLPPLSEGMYWFGLRSMNDREKNWSYTEGSGWVYLRPGKHHFVFETVPTATVEGRLHMRELDRSLCVALADETGRLLRARADRWSVDSIFQTGADGSFSISEAPVGRFTLRVGHEEELRAGRFRSEQAIEVGPDGNKQIVIDVP